MLRADIALRIAQVSANQVMTTTWYVRAPRRSADCGVRRTAHKGFWLRQRCGSAWGSLRSRNRRRGTARNPRLAGCTSWQLPPAPGVYEGTGQASNPCSSLLMIHYRGVESKLLVIIVILIYLFDHSIVHYHYN